MCKGNRKGEFATYFQILSLSKEIEKGNTVSNFRPITCLLLLWKLLTAVLADELYRHLDENRGSRRVVEKGVGAQRTNC